MSNTALKIETFDYNQLQSALQRCVDWKYTEVAATHKRKNSVSEALACGYDGSQKVELEGGAVGYRKGYQGAPKSIPLKALKEALEAEGLWEDLRTIVLPLLPDGKVVQPTIIITLDK